MCGWCGDVSWSVWGWWLVPLIAMVLCITMCMLFRSRIAGGRFCCWSGIKSADLEELKKEIAVLKEEIGRNKGR